MPPLWRLIPSSVLRRRKNTKNAHCRIGEGAARVFPPRHAAGPGRRANVASPPRCALRRYQLPALCAMPRKPAHRRSTLRSLRRQCLMRDHPLTSSSTPHPRTLSTTSSRPQCVTRCHGGGSHSREVGSGKGAERRRAASQPPSQTLHHPQETAAPSERSNGDASAATRTPTPPTTQPPPRPQCKARPPPKHQHPPRQQPRQPRMQHHHAPVATTTRRPPISISTKGWGNFGLEHLPPPERKREREREREDDGGSKRTRAAGLNECTSYRI